MRGGRGGLTVLSLASVPTTPSTRLSPRSWPSSLVTQAAATASSLASTSLCPGPNLRSNSHCLKHTVPQVRGRPLNAAASGPPLPDSPATVLPGSTQTRSPDPILLPLTFAPILHLLHPSSISTCYNPSVPPGPCQTPSWTRALGSSAEARLRAHLHLCRAACSLQAGPPSDSPG